VVYDAEHAFDGYKEIRNTRGPRGTQRRWARRRGDTPVTPRRLAASEILSITRDARARLATELGITPTTTSASVVANALVALEAGATHIQGTINGYGERTGTAHHQR